MDEARSTNLVDAHPRRSRPEPDSPYRRVSLLALLVMGMLAAGLLLAAVLDQRPPSEAERRQLGLILAGTIGFLILHTAPLFRSAREVQLVLLVAAACYSIVHTPLVAPVGELLLMFAVYGAYRYRMLDRHAGLRVGTVTGLALVVVLLHPEVQAGLAESAWDAVARALALKVGFLVSFAAGFAFLIEAEARSRAEATAELEREIAESRTLARFGSNFNTIVHDFKNHLQVISDLSRVDGEPLKPSDRKKLERAVTRSQLMVGQIRMINDLVTMSTQLSEEQLSVVEAINASNLLVLSSYESRRRPGVEIQYVADHSFTGIRYYLFQLVDNLLKNAVEAALKTEHPEVLVELSGAVLTVSNRGPRIQVDGDVPDGIDILTFAGGRGVRSTTEGGSGIGLRAIRTAAARLGANVTLANDGNWVRATVVFPGQTK